MTDDASDLMRSTQHRVGRFKISITQGRTDSRGGHRFGRWDSVQIDQFMSQRFESELRTHLDQQRNISSTLGAEVEIASHGYEFCVQQTHEIFRNKLCCGLLGPLLVESHNKSGIDTTLSEQFEFLIKIGK